MFPNSDLSHLVSFAISFQSDVCNIAKLSPQELINKGEEAEVSCFTLQHPKIQNYAHYVNVSVLIKFSQNTSVFALIIISSP